jgi:hypothetical protein
LTAKRSRFSETGILAALRMLERERGPVVIEDFTEDDPRAKPDPVGAAASFPHRRRSSPTVAA